MFAVKSFLILLSAVLVSQTLAQDKPTFGSVMKFPMPMECGAMIGALTDGQSNLKEVLTYFSVGIVNGLNVKEAEKGEFGL